MLFDRNKATAANPAPDLDSQARHHRDRMAGMWAAELLGLIGHAAQDYARELAHGTGPGADAQARQGAGADAEDRVVGRLTRDLHGKVGAHEIREKLAHLLHEARRQLLNERKKH